MKEVIFISGKGGTGKTTISSAIGYVATLSGKRVVFADADVDASNLYLVLGPKILWERTFEGGKRPLVDESKCAGCGMCEQNCRFSAIKVVSGKAQVNERACEGCGVCAFVCPNGAVTMRRVETGKLMFGETRLGPMVWARLLPGEENSGKLVAEVREIAKVEAIRQKADLIIVDGPPGIGCPVMSALAGAEFAVIVTEPSLQALHDMERAITVAKGFGVKTFLVINKVGINPGLEEKIGKRAKELGAEVLGKVPHDISVFEAIKAGKTVAEAASKEVKESIKSIWDRLKGHLEVSLR